LGKGLWDSLGRCCMTIRGGWIKDVSHRSLFETTAIWDETAHHRNNMEIKTCPRDCFSRSPSTYIIRTLRSAVSSALPPANLSRSLCSTLASSPDRPANPVFPPRTNLLSRPLFAGSHRPYHRPNPQVHHQPSPQPTTIRRRRPPPHPSHRLQVRAQREARRLVQD
jgi:hypothetical protein